MKKVWLYVFSAETRQFSSSLGQFEKTELPGYSTYASIIVEDIVSTVILTYPIIYIIIKRMIMCRFVIQVVSVERVRFSVWFFDVIVFLRMAKVWLISSRALFLISAILACTTVTVWVQGDFSPTTFEQTRWRKLLPRAGLDGVYGENLFVVCENRR